MRLFSKAIEIDPGYGLAHALLASMYLRCWKNEPGEDDASLNEAYRLARKAVVLDNSEGTCFSTLGIVCMFLAIILLWIAAFLLRRIFRRDLSHQQAFGGTTAGLPPRSS